MNLKQIAEELKKKLQTVGNFLPPVQAYNAVKQIQTPQYQESVASVPYRVANAKVALGKAIKTPVNYDEYFNRIDTLDKKIETAPPLQQLPLAEQYFPTPQRTKDESAKLRWSATTYDASPPIQTNPYLEGIKQRVLSSPNIRPSAKEYLGKIPITYGDVPPEMMAVALGAKTERPNIVVTNRMTKPYPTSFTPQRKVEQFKYDEKQLEEVIKHELLHETPRLVPMELFHPKNQEVVNQYTQRWGTDYMKRNPNALVEEMFAEQDLPPAYYWHIYKRVQPNATKGNFINLLKSYFVNNINTLQQPIQSKGIPGTMGVYGQSTQ